MICGRGVGRAALSAAQQNTQDFLSHCRIIREGGAQSIAIVIFLSYAFFLLLRCNLVHHLQWSRDYPYQLLMRG